MFLGKGLYIYLSFFYFFFFTFYLPSLCEGEEYFQSLVRVEIELYSKYYVRTLILKKQVHKRIHITSDMTRCS